MITNILGSYVVIPELKPETKVIIQVEHLS